MAYFNRFEQLRNTLASIAYHYEGKYDYEVVLIDDASDEEKSLQLIEMIGKLSHCQYVKISKEEKGERLNPCIPFNIGFNFAKGDIIIIQNPENVHVSNVLKKVEENLEREKYLTFGCYSITEEQTRLLNDID